MIIFSDLGRGPPNRTDYSVPLGWPLKEGWGCIYTPRPVLGIHGKELSRMWKWRKSPRKCRAEAVRVHCAALPFTAKARTSVFRHKRKPRMSRSLPKCNPHDDTAYVWAEAPPAACPRTTGVSWGSNSATHGSRGTAGPSGDLHAARVLTGVVLQTTCATRFR